MVQSISSHGVGNGLWKAARMTEIMWKKSFCMFSFAGGSENSKLISLVLNIYLILLFSSMIFWASLSIECTVYIDRLQAS